MGCAIVPPPKRRQTFALSEEEFSALVQEAIKQVPSRYAPLLSNVAVVVEEEPPRDVLDDFELESEDDLLGLYHGSSLDSESFFQPGGSLPARISLYRGPLLRLCRTRKDLIQEIRDTLVHELGHHVGLDDEEMPY